jgi:hypothetical protein
MLLPSIDLPSWVWIIAAAAFWITVIAQWLSNQAEIQKLRETEKCNQCGKSDAQFIVEIVNTKSGQKVSLLKNVWGGLMLISIAILLFISLIGIISDLIQSTNATGIQNENWLGRIGTASFPLLVGLGCALYGIPLLFHFFVGTKEKRIRMKCNLCDADNSVEY